MWSFPPPGIPISSMRQSCVPPSSNLSRITWANQPHAKAQAPVYILHLINSLADTGIRVAGPVPPAARTGCSWLPPQWGARTPRPAELYREDPVSYTHLRAHETKANLVCRLLLEK